MKANKIVVVALAASIVAAVYLSGCRHPRRGVPVAPILPPILPPLVILDDPFYLYGGYYYLYRDDCWYYSHHRSGPWIILPRHHYPREIRYRDRYLKREKLEKQEKHEKPIKPGKPRKPGKFR